MYQTRRQRALIVLILAFISLSSVSFAQGKSVVSIEGNKFLINGTPTYAGRTWQGYPIEGLLMNSRMVQGVFDDMNADTVKRWIYPDTKTWDADRNTNEFVDAMAQWKQHGLLAVTVNLQGGSPMGYGNKGWYNSTFTKTGELRPAYQKRMEKILARADELGMVIILGLFYFGQDQYLNNEAAVINAVDNSIEWLHSTGYRNILIEINNESNVAYDHEILKPERVHELILRVKKLKKNGKRFLVGTSYGGNYIPHSNVAKSSDFILIHGNGVKKTSRIKEMVKLTKEVKGYHGQPILFNEDDHYDFDKPMNNMVAAVQSYASWGYFDFRRKGEAFEEGYQCPPVDWGINSERKRAFFNKLQEITGTGVVRFPGGRIAYSADGNQHDKDDIGATPMSLALFWASGLGSKLVHYDFSNHLGDNNPKMDKDMIESAIGGAKRFKLNQAVFFNAQTQLDEAIENFRIQGNKSSAENPLWYICAGPMEVAWRCVKAVDPDKRKHIHCISHSGWNDRHNDTKQMNHQWKDLGKLGATLHHIKDQNGSNGDDDFNGPHDKWTWLRDSEDPNFQWLYLRNKFTHKFDVSDSGMMYWLITGGPNSGNDAAGWKEAKALLKR